MTRNNSHGTHKGSSQPVGAGQPNLTICRGSRRANQVKATLRDRYRLYFSSFVYQGTQFLSHLRCFAVAVFVVVLIVHLRSVSNHRWYWRLTPPSSFLTSCVPLSCPVAAEYILFRCCLITLRSCHLSLLRLDPSLRSHSRLICVSCHHEDGRPRKRLQDGAGSGCP